MQWLIRFYVYGGEAHRWQMTYVYCVYSVPWVVARGRGYGLGIWFINLFLEANVYALGGGFFPRLFHFLFKQCARVFNFMCSFYPSLTLSVCTHARARAQRVRWVNRRAPYVCIVTYVRRHVMRSNKTVILLSLPSLTCRRRHWTILQWSLLLSELGLLLHAALLVSFMLITGRSLYCLLSRPSPSLWTSNLKRLIAERERERETYSWYLCLICKWHVTDRKAAGVDMS